MKYMNSQDVANILTDMARWYEAAVRSLDRGEAIAEIELDGGPMLYRGGEATPEEIRAFWAGAAHELRQSANMFSGLSAQ